MSILDKIIGTEKPRCAVHFLYSALAELAEGEITRAQMITYFELSAAEEVELDFLIAEYQSAANNRKQEWLVTLHRILMLAEGKAPGYSTPADVQARIQRF